MGRRKLLDQSSALSILKIINFKIGGKQDERKTSQKAENAIEPFREEVMPIYNKEEYYDYTDICEMENLTDEYWIAA